MKRQRIKVLVSPSYYVPLVLFIILLIIPLITPDPFTLHVFFMIFLYGFLAEAFNIIGGFAGQFSLCQTVFFGIGAYTSSLLFMWYGISPWVGMVVGGIFAMAISGFIGYPCFRLRGHYFVLATLALGEVNKTLFLNWRAAGAAVGVWMTVLPDTLLYFQFHISKAPYYYIALAFLLLGVFVAYRTRRSRLGYGLIALQQDEVAAENLGINTARYKLIAFAISAFLTAIGGTLYAQYTLFICPYSLMTFWVMDQILLVAILGGLGHYIGPVIGAFILIPTSEYVRAFLGGGYQGIYMMTYGIILMLMMLIAPSGIVGEVMKRYASMIRKLRILAEK